MPALRCAIVLALGALLGACATPEPESPKKELPRALDSASVEAEVGADTAPVVSDNRSPEEHIARGDYYFSTGYFLKASDSYRNAVLAEPANASYKLTFGYSLFAIGNYSYACYALRRGVSQQDPEAPFEPDVVARFPSRKVFQTALKDLKRYVTYSPRDPSGITVLCYMLYAQKEDEKAREFAVYLPTLPKNDKDPFAAFILKQLDRRKAVAPARK